MKMGITASPWRYDGLSDLGMGLAGVAVARRQRCNQRPRQGHSQATQLFHCAERPQTLSHPRLRLSTAMKCPAEGRALPNGVPNIQPRAALDQEPHHRFVARQDCLVQWRRVGMVTLEIVAVGTRVCRWKECGWTNHKSPPYPS